eukprot:403336517
MKSALIATLIGYAACQQVFDTSSKIEISQEKWMGLNNQPEIYDSVSELFLNNDSQKLSDCKPGVVTWQDCDCDGNFQTDFQNTYSIPAPAIKGQSVKLHLSGVFTDSAQVSGVKVYVEWNKTPLYVNDFPRSVSAQPGDTYTDDIDWMIPSFAPSGQYQAWVRIHDKQSTPEIYGCALANFCF